MPKVKKTFRIEEETASHLGELAAREGVTATELLERAIRAYGSEPYAEPYACHTPSHTPENAADEPPAGGVADDAASVAVAALAEQLAVKDRQIADLSAALVSAQKSIEQAHALHAADKQAVLAEPAANVGDANGQTAAAQAPSRWQRLKNVLRG